MRREGSNWLLCKTKQGKKCKFLRTDQAANFNLFFYDHHFFLLLFFFILFLLLHPSTNNTQDVIYFFVIWPPPYKSASEWVKTFTLCPKRPINIFSRYAISHLCLGYQSRMTVSCIKTLFVCKERKPLKSRTSKLHTLEMK